MRTMIRRLRRLGEQWLPPAETAESRRLREVVLGIRLARAARLGIPVEEDGPDHEYRPGMSLADGIRAARERRPRAEAASTLLSRRPAKCILPRPRRHTRSEERRVGKEC